MSNQASHGSTPPVRNPHLEAWVAEVAKLTRPDRIHWCTGSDEEWTELTDALVGTGTFTRLNPAIKPNSFYAASDPIVQESAEQLWGIDRLNVPRSTIPAMKAAKPATRPSPAPGSRSSPRRGSRSTPPSRPLASLAACALSKVKGGRDFQFLSRP